MTHEAGQSGHEPLGTVGEEAAKLLGALQDWAHDAAGAGEGRSRAEGAQQPRAHDRDCTWCPVCQAVQMVRQTSPEVKTHLAVAASSLLQAAAALLDAQPAPRGDAGVQKIDLDDDASWDEPDWDAD